MKLINIINIILMLSVAILLIFTPKPKPTTTTKYIYDTITHYIPSKPTTTTQYIIKTDTLTIIKPSIVDTPAIINNYFTKVKISRSWTDSLVNINITDTLYKNNIIASKIEYKLLKPQIINTTFINKQKKITFGINAGYGLTKNGFSPYVGFGLQFNLN